MNELEQSEHVRRRKTIYEQLFPETKKDSSALMSKVRRADNMSPRQPSFAKDPEPILEVAYDSGRATELVAKKVGVSHNTLEQARKIKAVAESDETVADAWEQAKSING